MPLLDGSTPSSERVVRKALRAHLARGRTWWENKVQCECGDIVGDHEAHVAAAVMSELHSIGTCESCLHAWRKSQIVDGYCPRCTEEDRES
ncbi:hypothetical protein BH769_gp48 [Gordonia phage BritBrat]|uniref:Uncharacterized protein n=1 Tax=Gordonia phage BritBrat TaxID=1838064 RepID=A0A166Y187_9CAUD|nr:hypothetical protein BH769_gp48 [Gordonia phage BritBrat]ANA85305.1 hypothetical protein PBI_BRITBRAT_48 [Gordonia phage BritBrat]